MEIYDPTREEEDDRKLAVISVLAYLKECFSKSSNAEVDKFLHEWDSTQAREARLRLYWGKFQGAENMWWILARLREARSHGWPWERMRNLPAPDGKFNEAHRIECEMSIVGSMLFRWIASGDCSALRFLADVAEGKRIITPASTWKSAILSAFAGLCESANWEMLPTKHALREALASRGAKGGELEEKRFRRYSKELGLAGLPRARSGPRKL